MENMIGAQIVCTTEKMLVKVILAPVAESLDDILQCTYENTRKGVRSVFYNVV